MLDKNIPLRGWGVAIPYPVVSLSWGDMVRTLPGADPAVPGHTRCRQWGVLMPHTTLGDWGLGNTVPKHGSPGHGVGRVKGGL